MKFANITLIIVVLIIVAGLFGLSSVFAATGAGQVNLLAPQIDVQATARAIKLENRQTELEDTTRQRLQVIQAHIDQTQRSLDELGRIMKSQASQQNEQLATLQEQLARQKETVDDLRASAAELNRAIVQDETNHILELTTLQAEFEKSEGELNASLQQVQTQIASAEQQLDDHQPLLPSRTEGAPINVTSTSGGNDNDGSSNSSSDEKSDHKSDDDHDDDHEEDHS